MKKAYMLHLSLQLLDFYTTKLAFKLSDKNRRVKELNPVTRRFTDSGKWEELFLFKMASTGVPWLVFKVFFRNESSDEELRQMFNVVNTIYGAAVVNNIIEILDLLTPEEFPYGEITSQDY